MLTWWWRSMKSRRINKVIRLFSLHSYRWRSRLHPADVSKDVTSPMCASREYSKSDGWEQTRSRVHAVFRRLGTFSFTLTRDVTFLYRYLKFYPLFMQPRRDFEGTIRKNWPLSAANQMAASVSANHKAVDSFTAITQRYFVFTMHILLAVKLSFLLCVTKIRLIFSELKDGGCRRILPSWTQHRPFTESMVKGCPSAKLTY